MQVQEVVRRLQAHISDHYNGSQSDFADANKLSQAYVSCVLRRTRLPGPKILKAIGLKKVVDYQEK